MPSEKFMKYRGYSGSNEVSLEDECLFGRIMFIDDIVNYEGENVAQLKKSFEQSVDRYLKYCDENGKEPNKPYKGTFNVRIPAELHRKAACVAMERQITLNEFVGVSLQAAVEGQTKIIQHQHHHNTIVVSTVDEPMERNWMVSSGGNVGELPNAH